MRAGISILLITFLATLQGSLAQGSDSKSTSAQGSKGSEPAGSASSAKSAGSNSTNTSPGSPAGQGSDSNQPRSGSNILYSSSKRDPIEEKYGATAASIKRLDPLLNDAQNILSNTEYTYFQSKLSSLKDNAANDVGEGRQRGMSFVEPMKSLEAELSNSIEQAKQTYSQNKLKLDNALEHLHATFSDRRSSLSRQDQARFIDMMNELETRVRSVTSSSETANRIASLTEEVANLEAQIVGRTLFNNNSSVQNDPDSRSQKRSSVRVLPDNKNTADDDPPPIPIPQTRLVDPPKPSLSQMLEKIEALIKQLSSRGNLGSLDEEQFQRRLSLQKKIMQTASASSGGKQQISQAQQETIRKELEQLLLELSNRGAN